MSIPQVPGPDHPDQGTVPGDVPEQIPDPPDLPGNIPDAPDDPTDDPAPDGPLNSA